MSIETFFIDNGGLFLTDSATMAIKLRGIKAFIFDWDGVFNNGQKNIDGGSSFSEIDSMGTNLLRYSHYVKNGRLPLTAVISGEKNDTAFYFCKRECFDYSFFKAVHKTDALNFICEKENILPSEVCYFFDDVLDLSIAEICGLRMMVNRKANPLFVEYCIKNKLVDYLTGSEGGNNAVREATEILMALNENFDKVMRDRTHYTNDYKTYIEQRKLTTTQFYTVKENAVEKVEL